MPIVSLPSRLPSDPDPTATLAAAHAAGITITATEWPKLSVAPADKFTPELRQMVAADKWAIMAHLLEPRLTAGMRRMDDLKRGNRKAKQQAALPSGYARLCDHFEFLLSCYQAAWQAATDSEYRERLEGYHAKYAAEVVA